MDSKVQSPAVLISFLFASSSSIESMYFTDSFNGFFLDILF